MTDKKGIDTSFDRLPNKEAQKHFNQKSLITSAEFAEFKAYQHALAFTVAGLADKDMLAEVHKAVKSAIDNGTSFNEFKKSLKPFLISKGWLAPELTGDKKTDKELLKDYETYVNRRLKTIYHTNKSTAYAAGRWERLQRTKERFPYLQYIKTKSAKYPRDEHKAYYGIVRHIDDPIWQSIFPPNGFGCKCWVKPLTADEAREIGISTDDEVAGLPVPDFDSNFDRLGGLLRLAEDKHGKEFAEKLEKGVEPILRKITTSQRNDLPLTDQQKDDVIKVVGKYDIDLNAVKFVENNNTAFVSMYGMELLQIGLDVYPTNNPHIYKNANSTLSMKATIAHELAGHRDAQLADKTHSDDLLEEVQASIRASMYGIDLTDEERQMLYQDALDRLAKNGVQLDDIKHTLWLEPFGKTK